jgi:hypothetical protein
MSLGSRLAKAPALHFLLLGALAFAFARSNTGRALLESKASPEIVIDADGLDGKALDAAIEEEILVREALALGIDRDQRVVEARLNGLGDFLELDRDTAAVTTSGEARKLDLQYRDPIIRRHLATLVRMMLSRIGTDECPSDTELEAYLRANATTYSSPARVRMTHIYLSRDRRGPSLAGDATRLAAALADGSVRPRDAARLGDPFVYGSADVLASEAEIQRIFGPAFAAASVRIQPRAWSGPIESTYGLHFVWIEERIPSRVPPLNEVRSRVLHDVLAQRRDTRLGEGLAALRARYQVRVANNSDSDASPR